MKLDDGLPIAEVTAVAVAGWSQNSTHALKGGVLIAGTRGRGAWEVADFLLMNLSVLPTLTIQLSPGVRQVASLALNPNLPTELDVFVNGVFRKSFSMDDVYQVVVLGDGADDTLQVDANIHVPGDVIFDDGTGAMTSQLQVFGTARWVGGHTVLVDVQDPVARNGYGVVQDAAQNLVLQYRGVGSRSISLSPDRMALFRSGLGVWANLSQINNVLSRQDIPFLGRSLADTVTGNRPSTEERELPLTLPPGPQGDMGLIEGLAAQGLTMDDLQGEQGSIIGRLLTGGPLGNILDAIGSSISDPAALNSA